MERSKASQPGTLEWSVPTDQGSYTNVIVELVAGDRRFRPIDLGAYAVPRPELVPRFEGSTYRFTLLPEPPDGGPAEISDAVLEVTTLDMNLGTDHCAPLRADGLCGWEVRASGVMAVQQFPVTVR